MYTERDLQKYEMWTDEIPVNLKINHTKYNYAYRSYSKKYMYM